MRRADPGVVRLQAGGSFLRRVVEDLRAGRVTKNTDRLANALEGVLEGRISPVKLDAELGLRRPRGRPPGNTTFGRRRRAGDFRDVPVAGLADHLDPACRFILGRISEDHLRGARARALDAAAERFHVDRRALERRWQHAQPGLALIRVVQELSAKIEAARAAE